MKSVRTRREWTQAGANALHPTFRQLRLAAADAAHPIAPVGLAVDDVAAVAADEIIVGEHEQARRAAIAERDVVQALRPGRRGEVLRPALWIADAAVGKHRGKH